MRFFRFSLLGLILTVGVAFLTGCTLSSDTNTNRRTPADDLTDTVDAVTGIGAVETKLEKDRDLAVAKAKELWRARFLSGDDLSDGPCLSEEAIPGWVADIAHNPRTEVDDLLENQCSGYRNGTARHFVELDASGNLIRAE